MLACGDGLTVTLLVVARLLLLGTVLRFCSGNCNDPYFQDCALKHVMFIQSLIGADGAKIFY